MIKGRLAARVLAAALGVPLAMAAASTSHAQDLMSLSPGTKIEHVASIGNKQVPLPGGKWEVVLSEADRRGSVKAGSVFLVRKANGEDRRIPLRQNEPGSRERLWVETAGLVRPQQRPSQRLRQLLQQGGRRLLDRQSSRLHDQGAEGRFLQPDEGLSQGAWGHLHRRRQSLLAERLLGLPPRRPFRRSGGLRVSSGAGETVDGKPVARECGRRRVAAPRVHRRHEGIRREIPRGGSQRLSSNPSSGISWRTASRRGWRRISTGSPAGGRGVEGPRP